MTPRLLTAKDAAAYLSVSLSMFKTLGIPVLHIGRAARYDLQDLDAFIERLRAKGAA